MTPNDFISLRNVYKYNNYNTEREIMGLCGSRASGGHSLERPHQHLLTVWGDYFNADTRSIITLIKMGSGDTMPYYFKLVDEFQNGAYSKEELLKVNPMGTVPTVVEGRQVIIGSFVTFLQYLMCNHNQIKSRLYPEDKRQQIDGTLHWFQAIMRVCSTKLIKMVVLPKAFGQKPFSQEEVKREQDEFFNIIVPQLDKGVC